MITFLIVYKHNSAVSEFKNMKFISDGAPTLSEIQLKIMKDHDWDINDFAIINIIPIKTEIFEHGKNEVKLL